MKNIVTIVLLLASVSLSGQIKDQLAEIRTKSQQINQRIKTFNEKAKEDNTQSTDGGTITAYYKNKQLQLIFTEYLGENGKIKTQYYFDNGVLIFVLDTEFDYNRPYYWNKSADKKNNDTSWYDYKKTINKVNRFYFINDKLIGWINDKNRKVDASTPLFSERQSGILSETKRLMKLLN